MRRVTRSWRAVSHSRRHERVPSRGRELQPAAQSVTPPAQPPASPGSPPPSVPSPALCQPFLPTRLGRGGGEDEKIWKCIPFHEITSVAPLAHP